LATKQTRKPTTNPPDSRPSVTRYVAIGALVLAVLLIGSAGFMMAGSAFSTPKPTATPTKQPTAVTATTPLLPTPTIVAGPTVPAAARVERYRGNPASKVTIIEYSDFQCPFCADFATQTYPKLYDKYIKTNLVKWVFKPILLPNHAQSPKALESAECAGDQGKYWEMHDMLFARQIQWAEKGGAVEIFKGYAKTLGLDEAAFGLCLDGGKYRLVGNLNGADAQKAAISGTPTFFINSRVLGGNYPFEQFVTVIDEELAK
jgi:protein-disulfide isomerase